MAISPAPKCAHSLGVRRGGLPGTCSTGLSRCGGRAAGRLPILVGHLAQLESGPQDGVVVLQLGPGMSKRRGHGDDPLELY